ncbi:hypothetical protein J3458_012343 [Metarhizium acridum]|uniref:uncharacterized protein n=1 Tax=Metarhizium acridum TaxID=92637 RepID=UPI001C6C10DE|nr:hypothetical protein J3458_012343 [Metarhizium acridum]
MPQGIWTCRFSVRALKNHAHFPNPTEHNDWSTCWDRTVSSKAMCDHTGDIPARVDWHQACTTIGVGHCSTPDIRGSSTVATTLKHFFLDMKTSNESVHQEVPVSS